MNLLVENGKTVGLEDGDITLTFAKVSDPQKILIDDETAQRLSDLNDPLHASNLTFKDGKIVVPKVVKKADDTEFV